MKFFIFLIISVLIAFIVGRISKKVRVLTLTDSFKLNPKRTPAQHENDKAMRLANEIANSGAIHTREMKDGYVEITIQVVTG